MRKDFLNFKEYLQKTSKEAWKYTDFFKYDLASFHSIEDVKVDLEDKALLSSIQSLLSDFKLSNQIIFYNGRILFESIPSVCSLSPLSTTTYQEGLKLLISKNAVLTEPIYLIQVIHSETTSLEIQPKNLIIAEAFSEITLVEIYLTIGKKPSFIFSNTKLQLATGAKIQHLFLQQSLSNSLQAAHLQIEQASKSYYQGTSFIVGGAISHTNFEVHLNEKNAECQFYALTAPRQRQQIDSHFTVYHHQPECESKIIARGISQDKAKNAFKGKIIIQPEAIKSKASLENKNLLLSESADIVTQPELEIYNDDVQCTHGATVSALDPEALFYLQSRGIPEIQARELLIDSFMTPSLQGLSSLHQDYVARLVHEH